MAIEGVSISSYKHSVIDNGNGTSTVKYNLNEHWIYKDGAFTDEQPLTKSGTKSGTGMYAAGVTVSDYHLKNGRSYSGGSTTIDKMFLVSSLVNDYTTKYTISTSCVVSNIITTHSNASLQMQVLIIFYDSSGEAISTLRGRSEEINAFSGSKTFTATKEITIPSNAYYFQPCTSVYFYPNVYEATTVADTFTYMGGDFVIETVQPTSTLPASTPTTITYNGNEIASLEAGQTATLPCNGEIMTSDVVIAFGANGTITYNGTETAVSAGHTATLSCEGKKMSGDVVVAV